MAIFRVSLICIIIIAHSEAMAAAYTDGSELLAFKSRLLDGISSLNWYDNNTSLLCNWTGVTCGSRHPRVTGLDLSGMGLSGNLPPEIGNLTFLVNLNLSHNHFNGDLPHELSRLRRLKFMDFASNDFSGEFPSWIGMLNELRTLRMSSNSFTGSLTYSLFNASKLEKLILSQNNIEGSIPASIFNISNLVLLNLNGNKFSGTLPSPICSGNQKLQFLILSRNDLQGKIPSNFTACSQLQWIILGGNKLSGSIPSDMSSHSSQIQVIELFRNQLGGQLPRNIGEWKALEEFQIYENNITGTIPTGLSNLTRLWGLDLSFNKLTGTIPKDLGRLRDLKVMSVGSNNLIGEIPMDMFNISTLEIFSISWNRLTGKLPLNFCSGLPNLTEVYMDGNELYGGIPQSISNCTNLRILCLNDNNFGGFISHNIGSLRFLERLILNGNDFICESRECSFITALTSCRHLHMMELSNNYFNAPVPKTVGNFSTSLECFSCFNSGLGGILPIEFGNLTQIVALNLNDNNFIGSIPSTIGNLKNLQGFYLASNNITGVIPDALCALVSSNVIYLYGNQISGSIPTCIGNMTSLRSLFISNNKLESSIPSSLWQLINILKLNLSSNLLNGSLSSDIGRLNAAVTVDISANRFSGTIPISIGGMKALSYLSLAYNEFEGLIPETIGSILSLVDVNLSHNRLTGNIPLSLQTISSLISFDVSFNNLTGLIPSKGPFQNFSYQYFESNEGLCGDSRFGVPPCKLPNHGRKTILILSIVLSTFFAALFALFLAYILWTRLKGRGKTDVKVEENQLSNTVPVRISYYQLLRATDTFNDDNLLGIGSFGSVFKGILDEGNMVAIKVFNLDIENAFKSFNIECNILRNIRHRNLCKVISACSNDHFKAIIMEYMPNGNLEKWIHNEFLNTFQRFRILIDIASALEYLHQNSISCIVHCDVKPSNILFDVDMIPHLSDFGISKLLGDIDSFVETRTFATLGYIAPEYGSEGLVSTKCDVYSFGVVIMEVFIGKRPSDDEFNEDLSLRDLVNKSLQDGIIHILDSRLLNLDSSKTLECIFYVLELALKCSAQNPNERMSMKDVRVSLEAIFSKLPGNIRTKR